jgi:hypothetical protein
MKTIQDIEKEKEARLANQKKIDFMSYQWARIIEKHPWISNDVAHIMAVLEACGDDPIKVTLENVDKLLEDTGPQSLRTRLGDPVARNANKKAVIDRIIELLRPYRDDISLRNEVARMQFWTVPQLEAREQEIIGKQHAQKMSKSDLREVIKRPGYAQFEELPGTYHGVPWGTKMFSRLDAITAKSLIRRYGADQLNEAFRASAAKGISS